MPRCSRNGTGGHAASSSLIRLVARSIDEDCEASSAEQHARGHGPFGAQMPELMRLKQCRSTKSWRAWRRSQKPVAR
jgi:hypothetical protein